LLDSEKDILKEWEQLERAMKQQYEDEMRVLEEKLLLENADIDDEDAREFRVDSTGALLDLDNAVQHLYHFCATLPSTDYVDLRPEFICSEAGPSLVRARVILPLSVDEAVRTAESRTSWKSERNAIKDAAFEAYFALYKAGLVNQNLLPLLRHDPIELSSSAVETRTALMVVNDQLNPWVHIAQRWIAGHEVRHSIIYLDGLRVSIYLPMPGPSISSFQLYWDPVTNIRVTATSKSTTMPRAELPKVIEDTWSLFQASFGSRFPVQKQQHVVLFSPSGSIALKDRLGYQEISEQEREIFPGLIREQSEKNVLYIFKHRLSAKPLKELVQRPHKDYDLFPCDTPHLSLTRLPRRLDFLHKIQSGNQSPSEKPHSVVLPTSKCTMDDMPFQYVQFGLLIPSIMRRYEIHLLAEILSTIVLKDVGIQDSSLVVTAISASSANEESNYQRLEFIGDSILKLCTSVQLTAEYPQWHEGYLSAMKDRFVSNARLSRAAVETGLDKFIVTKAFTGHKWRPSYVDDLLESSNNSMREISSKVLADVVEALIGAAMVDGGLPKALKCLQVFLPDMQWQTLEMRQSFLFKRAPDVELPTTLEPLETLLGYTFRKKSLLVESMTHASCNIGTGSLERFEFLGDSILDNLVVTALQEQYVELSHVQMHLFRTALVNADFLAFLCMEWAVKQEKTGIVEVEPTINDQNDMANNFVTQTTTASLPLWSFMRHHSPKLGAVQVETAMRHAELREQIIAAIHFGSHYPWALLSRLQALKFYSDLVESLLGALWIDSGSFEICRGMVERLGILPYLRRILADNVHLWHPKEELGQLAVTETVKYVVGFVHSEGELGRLADAGMVNGIVKTPDDRFADKRYWCKVFIGGKLTATVNNGVSRIEVQTRAAERAVWIMKARRRGEHISEEAVAGSMEVDEKHDVHIDADMVMDS
jgi:dsRNA-specific ribonuclease